MSGSSGDGIPSPFYTADLAEEAFGIFPLFPGNRYTPKLEISGPNADIIAEWLMGADLKKRPTDQTP